MCIVSREMLNGAYIGRAARARRGTGAGRGEGEGRGPQRTTTARPCRYNTAPPTARFARRRTRASAVGPSLRTCAARPSVVFVSGRNHDLLLFLFCDRFVPSTETTDRRSMDFSVLRIAVYLNRNL